MAKKLLGWNRTQGGKTRGYTMQDDGSKTVWYEIVKEHGSHGATWFSVFRGGERIGQGGTMFFAKKLAEDDAAALAQRRPELRRNPRKVGGWSQHRLGGQKQWHRKLGKVSIDVQWSPHTRVYSAQRIDAQGVLHHMGEAKTLAAAKALALGQKRNPSWWPFGKAEAPAPVAPPPPAWGPKVGARVAVDGRHGVITDRIRHPAASKRGAPPYSTWRVVADDGTTLGTYRAASLRKANPKKRNPAYKAAFVASGDRTTVRKALKAQGYLDVRVRGGAKRAPSAYNAFLKEQMPIVKAKGLTTAAAMKEIGALWKKRGRKSNPAKSSWRKVTPRIWVADQGEGRYAEIQRTDDGYRVTLDGHWIKGHFPTLAAAKRSANASAKSK